MSAQLLRRPLAACRVPATTRTHRRGRSLLVIGALLVPALIGSPPARAGDEASLHRAKATSISLQVLPPIRQPGSEAASSSAAMTVVTATLTPPRSGQVLTLEHRSQRGWTAAATLTTNAAGRAEFFVPATGRTSYRVVARSLPGQARAKSDAISTDLWGTADFVDEFTGETVGSAWQDRIQFYNPWGGRSCSKGSPAAVRAEDGALLLSSMPDPTATAACPAVDNAGRALGDFSYRLNGHVSTQDSFDFLYGVAAARMKFQREPGAHPSFWLQPRGLLEHFPTPWGAEIDVVEWYGQMGNRGRMSSTVHAPLPTGDKRSIGGTVSRPSRFLTSRSDTWWRSYHVFSVEWTPTEYVFRIDGHEVWRTDQGISHHPEFLILSMLSSDFELPRLGDRQDDVQTAAVDWVKVWQGEVA